MDCLSKVDSVKNCASKGPDQNVLSVCVDQITKMIQFPKTGFVLLLTQMKIIILMAVI